MASQQFYEEDLKEAETRFEINLYTKENFLITNGNNVKMLTPHGSKSCCGNKIMIIGNGNNQNKKHKIIKEIEWTIEINKISGNILIGIIEEKYWRCVEVGAGANWQYPACYSLGCSTGYKMNDNFQEAGYCNGIRGATSIVIMTLNVENKTLSYKIDDYDYGIAFNNIKDGNYRFGIECYEKDNEVTILKEDIIKYQDKNAIIMNIENKLRDWSLDIELLCKKINNEMKNSNIEAVKAEQTLKDLNNIKLKQEEFEKNIYSLLTNKINEYEKSLNEIINPNKNNYKEWKINNIINWIMSLDNGVYTAYCPDLANAFAERNIEGEDLQYINKDDLSKYGVKKFGHCVSLCQHIDSLIKQTTN